MQKKKDKKKTSETTLRSPALLGDETAEVTIPSELPVVPLRDIVVFPFMIFPILAGRPASQKAIENAVLNERMILLLTQKEAPEEEPRPEGLYHIGVVGRILQVLRLPTGVVKILVEGLERAQGSEFRHEDGALRARVKLIAQDATEDRKTRAAVRRVTNIFREYVILNKNLPDELLFTLENIAEPGRAADFIASHIPLSMEKRQNILETADAYERCLIISKSLNEEVEILKIEKSIDSQVKEKITRSQRNFYLQEQMRVIRKELGEEQDDDYSDIQEYTKKIRKVKMSKQARQKAREELEKLKQMPIMSPEAAVIRGYLDWLTDIPWFKRTEDNLDINSAAKILDEDHYGLKKPKERILEYLAVMKLVEKMRGQIICFVGPPGVGKTSLGKSIARSLGRNFIRMSLGGMRDEAEIRGHRRTYIGSLPGRIIQQMKRAGTINPVFLLDEVDKMASDFRGDPAAALLEVLDPEQNNAFNDHYLEVDYDLSQVMFITTANVRHNIPRPLLDRMEVIELPGYLRYEKFMIARHFLVPKNLKEHGLQQKPVEISDKALYKIIDDYTREAGVRELERHIARIYRRIARQIVTDDKGIYNVKVSHLEKYLGVPRYIEKEIVGESRVGSANALAWTSDGGDIMRIEVVLMKGKGKLTLTGQLGEVMRESAQASLSFIRSIADRFKLEENDFLRREIHIHIEEGAVPKDGPSAGVALAVAMLSAFTGKSIPPTVGFTGEITLRGEILPIGGLPEKLMAANRLGLKTIFIPAKNRKELKEIPIQVTKPLHIKTVRKFDEVIEALFNEKHNN